MVCLPDEVGLCPILAELADEDANLGVNEDRKWERAEFSSLIEFHRLFPNESYLHPIIAGENVEFDDDTYTAVILDGELMFFLARDKSFGPDVKRTGPMFLYERPFYLHHHV